MVAMLTSAHARGRWIMRTLFALNVFVILTLPATYLLTTTGGLADDATHPNLRDPSPEFLPKPTPSEERFLVMLQEPTEMHFTETPLQDAVDFLKHQHGIEIQLDNRSLEDAAIGSDTPVTRTVSDVKLKSGLELLLRDMDLTYIIKNEVMLITTKDKAETDLLTLTYPVGDLVEQENGATLIKAIVSTVRPTTWSEVGGPASIVYVPSVKGLVISQTRDVHGDVLELLRALRGVRRVSRSADAKAN